jgi:hypothetical protein
VAQDRNTYQKRHRETQKRQKAEDKRARRQKKKEAAGSPEALNGDGRPLDLAVDPPAASEQAP